MRNEVRTRRVPMGIDAQKLKAWIDNEGLSYNQLGRRIGNKVSCTTIQKWVAGGHEPDPDLLAIFVSCIGEKAAAEFVIYGDRPLPICGEKLKCGLRRKCMTLNDAERVTGITNATISAYTLGKRKKQKHEAIARLVQVFGDIQADDF